MGGWGEPQSGWHDSCFSAGDREKEAPHLPRQPLTTSHTLASSTDAALTLSVTHMPAVCEARVPH